MTLLCCPTVCLHHLKTNPSIIQKQPLTTTTGNHPFSALDWAIAGTSEATPLAETNDGQHVSHATWRHWIDSRTANTDGLVDKGDNYPQPPDGIKTLEHGEMVNPATGAVTKYEELWQSEDIKAVPLMPIPFMPVLGAGAAEGEGLCMVLELGGSTGAAGGELGGVGEDSVKRGMVVRLGQYCQAIVRTGPGDGDVSVERWGFDAAKGEWARTVRVGDTEAPSEFAMYFGHEAVVGDEVKVSGDVWRVVEKS